MKAHLTLMAALAMSISAYSVNIPIEECESMEYAVQTNNVLTTSLNRVRNHVSGSQTLTNNQIVAQQSIIKAESAAFGTNPDVIDLAFDVVSTYLSLIHI